MGKGNPRLISWDGERTVTFTMEDALISAESFMMLSGAGLVEASASKPIFQHMVTMIDAADVELTGGELAVNLPEAAYVPSDENDNFAYVTLFKNDEPISEPFIPEHYAKGVDTAKYTACSKNKLVVKEHPCYVSAGTATYTPDIADLKKGDFDAVQVDYYVARSNAKQIDITADSFGGNFYIEASTLFRNTDGIDLPAEFIIPNGRIQSNFTFTMASTGDPSKAFMCSAA